MDVVMVVDSNGDVAKNVYDALRETTGYHVVITRRTGAAALSTLRDGSGADIAVIDDRLEDMTGMDFLASLRQLAPEMPVIISSGHPSVESYLKAVNAGVFDFIPRPVSSPLLRSILSAALEGTDSSQLNHGEQRPIGGAKMS